MSKHVKFVALAFDGNILASHTHWNMEDIEDYASVLGQIFKSPGWISARSSDKRKFELRAGGNMYNIEIDSDGRVFIAVVTGK